MQKKNVYECDSCKIYLILQLLVRNSNKKKK